MNPIAGLTQAHYLKGYFLLHYLLQVIEVKQEFFQLLQVTLISENVDHNFQSSFLAYIVFLCAGIH